MLASKSWKKCLTQWLPKRPLHRPGQGSRSLEGKVPKVFHIDERDTQEAPLEPRQVIKAFFGKAAEFLDGLMLETGVRLDDAAVHTLKLALLADFIEVHNAASKHATVLPEDKAGVAKLLA